MIKATGTPRRTKKFAVVLVCLLVVIMVSARFYSGTSHSEKDQTSSTELAVSIADVYALIDPARPGFGTTDYPGNTQEDIPKSHAMVLLAELERVDNGLHPELPDLSMVSGRWLLENADLNKDGVIGWGVPVAWDAYGDGSENPRDTEYTISTAISVDALLTWMERNPKAPRKDILQTVEAALVPYLAPEALSPSGLAPYSLRASDQGYNTFNPAGYLAGQLQRFSGYASTPSLRTDFSALADKIVQVHLENQQINNATGSIYWHYSLEESVSNDIAHALYIVHGLQVYIEHKGKYADQIEMKAITRHLDDFTTPQSNTLRAWPVFRENIDRPARSYGLGMAMSYMCAREDLGQQGFALGRFIPQYLSPEGQIRRYPSTPETDEFLSINEYQNYLYHGVVMCEIWRARRAQETAQLNISVTQSAQERPSDTPLRQDLLPVVHGELTPDTRIQLLLFKDHGWTIEREIPSDQLILSKSHTSETPSSFQKVLNTHTDSIPVFRAAAASPDSLSLVYYDNAAQTNVLQTYKRAPAETSYSAQPPFVLPSLKDPAGGTYEMIPKVFILEDRAQIGALYIAAGPHVFHVKDGALLSTTQFENCTQIIEAIAISSEPVVLCRNLNAKAGQAVFTIQSLHGANLPQPKPNLPVFNLREDDGTVIFDQARTSEDLQNLLVFELENSMQNRWIQYGISNREARIPWDQIYYLNGFLDMLMLAQHDQEYQKLVKDIAPILSTRLQKEISIIGKHWRTERYQTRAFSVDRSNALFAVQTSRLLLLLQRYVDEVNPDDSEINKIYMDVKKSVHCLDGHIDQMTFAPQPEGWLKAGTPYLSWPKGSAFYFDGLNVPYNHQNEWAYAVLSSGQDASCPKSIQHAEDILSFFITRETDSGLFALNGSWDYWWGQAYEGWSQSDAISENKPDYVGDTIKAWISFRSIDVMSVLSTKGRFPHWVEENITASTQQLLHQGFLYPFVNQALVKNAQSPVLHPLEALKYSRAASSWEFQNLAWALLYYVQTFTQPTQ